MKKFTKLMLSVAAMTAVSTAMAVSAMAADTVTGTYAKDTGKVTLNGVVSSGDQQTLLVLNQNTTVTSENANAVIAQIDQAGAISEFILPANLTSGTYYIRIGGSDGTIQTGTLTIAEETPGKETKVIYIGDVDGDDWVGGSDAVMILEYEAELGTDTGDAGEIVYSVDDAEIYIGDVDNDEWVGGSDAVMILEYEAELGTDTGSAGDEVEVYVD